MAEADAGLPATTFLNWVRTLIPLDKYNIFKQLFSYPLPTPAIVEDVYRELERVFYSRNSSSTYQFSDSSLNDDWNKFRIDNLKSVDVWKVIGWQKMKVSINSILIVDLPQIQNTERPEPYFYWLDINNVIDFHTEDGQTFDYLIFKQADNNIAVFDKTGMGVYAVQNNKVTKVIYEASHNLGYCTARFFWTTSLLDNNKSLKKNPITKELSNLDWLLFFLISKRHLDLYAPYPIYSAYEADCNYENNETGHYCDGGYLRNSDGGYDTIADGSLVRCPRCGDKRIAGPGSFIDVPVPTEGVDMKEPVKITMIDADSLTYNVKECDRLQNNIIVSCVGSDGLVSEKEAINETQVAANFENKTSVLNALKTNFESAQLFVETTICKLRYGDKFINASISWGTEFYVMTIEDLYKKYKLAKENGASEAELDSLINKILETEYRTNPIQLQRMQILKQLEPYRHYTLNEVLMLYKSNLLDEEAVRLKINFSSYIDMFERENTNIVEFAKAISLKQKIEIITKHLYDYVRNTKTTIVSKAAESQKRESAVA